MRILKRQDFIDNALETYMDACAYPGFGDQKAADVRMLMQLKESDERQQEEIMRQCHIELPMTCCECGRSKDEIMQLGGDVNQEKIEICKSCMGSAMAQMNEFSQKCNHVYGVLCQQGKIFFARSKDDLVTRPGIEINCMTVCDVCPCCGEALK